MLPFCLAAFVVALSSSAFLTKLVRDTALRRRWTAPRLDHHLHIVPRPRLGGVAVVLAVLFSVAAVALLIRLAGPSRLTFGILKAVLLSGVGIFLLGLLDDYRPVRPYTKLTFEILAACLLFRFGLRFVHLPLTDDRLPWQAGLALTIVWVIVVTNAFNLVDGLDGLAAGSALFPTAVVFLVSLINHSFESSLLASGLAGAILGFLRYNFHPATIFLGDCGSLFIGFVLSALSLWSASESSGLTCLALLVAFGLPLFETWLSILRRIAARRPVFLADREHFHHKLLALGLSHRKAVTLLYACSAAFALLSVLLMRPIASTFEIGVATLAAGIGIGTHHFGGRKFGGSKAETGREDRLSDTWRLAKQNSMWPMAGKNKVS